jgi:hypothetical protein
MKSKTDHDDWTRFRGPNSNEVDFHRSGTRPGVSYDEKMAEVYDETLKALKDAQKNGTEYIIFTHGSSTSRLGKKTARSVV